MNRINWKTFSASLTAFLTVLAALPYELGDVATIIPAEWKAHVAIAAAFATMVLRLLKSGTDQTPLPEKRPNPELVDLPPIPDTAEPERQGKFKL